MKYKISITPVKTNAKAHDVDLCLQKENEIFDTGEMKVNNAASMLFHAPNNHQEESSDCIIIVRLFNNYMHVHLLRTDIVCSNLLRAEF